VDLNINGQTYATWDDVPEAIRKQLLELLPDEDKNGIPDPLERNVHTAAPTPPTPPTVITSGSILVNGKQINSLADLPQEVIDKIRGAGFGRFIDSASLSGVQAQGASDPGIAAHQMVLNGELVDRAGTTPPPGGGKGAVSSILKARPGGVARLGLFGLLILALLVIGAMCIWAYQSMGVVMDVGGTCASGGPYEIRQTCPEGSNYIIAAIPVLILMAVLGSAAALALGLPELVTMTWFLLFGILGWGFLGAVINQDAPSSMLVVGVMFWIMALPGLVLMYVFGAAISRVRLPASGSGLALGAPMRRTAGWMVVYFFLAVAGGWLGLISWDRMV